MTLTETNKKARFGFFAALFIASLAASLLFYSNYFLLIPFAALLLYAGWQDLRFLFFMLLFTLPLSTEVRVTGELSTDFPDELLMVAITGLFACFWVYRPRILTTSTLRHPLLLLLAITLMWSGAVAFASDYPILSLKFIAAKTWYLGAFVLVPLVLLKDRQAIITSAKLITASLLFAVVIIMVKHAFESFTFVGINEAVKPFFRNHVNYSAMLVCLIPVVFSFYRMSRNQRTKRYLAAALLFLLAALFLSFARGAWLALLTGAVAAWLMKKRLLLSAYLLMIVAVAGSVFWLQQEKRYLQYAHDYRSTIYHEDFREHLKATYELRDVSTAERFYRWIAGARMIGEQPVTGFGPGTFYNNYKGFTIPAYKTWVSRNVEQSTVHNYFLLVAIEQGVPGLILFLVLVGALLWYSQEIYSRSKDQFTRLVALNCGVILVMILTVNFLSDLIETDKVGSLFYLCLALLVILGSQQSTTKQLNNYTKR